MTNFVENQAVTYKGYPAFVRYVGEVHFKDGIWIGIEMTTASGKHDGLAHGIRYFKARPLSSLFVRETNSQLKKRVVSTFVPRISDSLHRVLRRNEPPKLNLQPNSSSKPKSPKQKKSPRSQKAKESVQKQFDETFHFIHPALRKRRMKEQKLKESGIKETPKLTAKSSVPLNSAMGRISTPISTSAHILPPPSPFSIDHLRPPMAPPTPPLVAAIPPPVSKSIIVQKESPKQPETPPLAPKFAPTVTLTTVSRDMSESSVSSPPPSVISNISTSRPIVPPPPPGISINKNNSAQPPAFPPPGSLAHNAPQMPPPPPPRPTNKKDEDDEDLGKIRRRLSCMAPGQGVDGGFKGSFQIPQNDSQQDRMFRTACRIIPQMSGCFGRSVKGYVSYAPNKVNQDSLACRSDAISSSVVFCVFDGHGEAGHVISQHFKREVPQRLFEHDLFEDDVPGAIKDVVAEAEDLLLSNEDVDCRLSGTTAVICVIRHDKMWVGNVGDSRLVMAFRENDKLKAVPLTIDHKPDSPGEKERIEDLEGRVYAMEYDDGSEGPMRVWLKDIDLPGLAMSRSLGDTLGKAAGVISTPEIFTQDITESLGMIILASDGVWEFMSDQEVVDLIQSSSSFEEASTNLIAESKQRWMDTEGVIDDTTFIVARFN